MWRFPAIELQDKQTGRFTSAGRYAHAVSTRAIIRKARQLQAPAVFIWEDDVVLDPHWREKLETVELPTDWGGLYLGCQHHIRPTSVLRCKKVTLDAGAYRPIR